MSEAGAVHLSLSAPDFPFRVTCSSFKISLCDFTCKQDLLLLKMTEEAGLGLTHRLLSKKWHSDFKRAVYDARTTLGAGREPALCSWGLYPHHSPKPVRASGFMGATGGQGAWPLGSCGTHQHPQCLRAQADTSSLYCPPAPVSTGLCSHRTKPLERI